MGVLLVDEVDLDHMIVEYVVLRIRRLLVPFLLHALLVESLLEELADGFRLQGIAALRALRVSNRIVANSEVTSGRGLQLVFVSINHGTLRLRSELLLTLRNVD